MRVGFLFFSLLSSKTANFSLNLIEIQHHSWSYFPKNILKSQEKHHLLFEKSVRMSVPFVQKIHKTTAYFLNESSF